jgi:hypothetical protein
LTRELVSICLISGVEADLWIRYVIIFVDQALRDGLMRKSHPWVVHKGLRQGHPTLLIFKDWKWKTEVGPKGKPY